MADVKVSESVGSVLDWMVMMARDGASVTLEEDLWIVRDGVADMPLDAYTPSTDWSQGGPIIERGRIRVTPNLAGSWLAQIRHEKSHPLVAHKVLNGWTNKHGPTPLIAAMRCYVASKLGDIVSVPDDLKGGANHG